MGISPSPTVDSARALVLSEKIYAVLALIILSGAFRPLLVGYADATEMAFADPVRIQLVLTGTYVVAAALLFRMKVLQGAHFPVPMPLILLLSYAAASFAWSSAPDLTLKRLVPLLGSALVGVYLGARFTLEGFLKLTFVALFVLTASSLLVGFTLPQYGIQPGEASWAGLRGVFPNKNELGWIAAFATLVSLYHIEAGRRQNRSRMWAGMAGLALAMFCVIQSLSVGSCINVAVTIVSLAALRYLQRSRNPVFLGAVCMALLLVGGIALSMVNLSTLFGVFGRDATLTGRVPLWNLAVQLIEARPGLGYGYAVLIAEQAPKLEAYFHVAHVHNGFLQVTLELGFLGLGLCLIFLGQLAARCVLLLMRTSSFRSTFSMSLLLLILLHNTTEVSLMNGHKLQWCLLVFLAVQTAIDLEGRRTTVLKASRPNRTALVDALYQTAWRRADRE